MPVSRRAVGLLTCAPGVGIGRTPDLPAARSGCGFAGFVVGTRARGWLLQATVIGQHGFTRAREPGMDQRRAWPEALRFAFPNVRGPRTRRVRRAAGRAAGR